MIQYSITIGNLISIGLTLIGSVCVVVGFVWAIRSSVTILDTRLGYQDRLINEIKDAIKEMEKDIRKFTEVIVDVASLNQRVTSMETRLTLMSNRVDAFITGTAQAVHHGNHGRIHGAGDI